MSSAISRIVIKSDHILRKIPAPGKVVSIVGEQGLFVVMAVDRSKHTVQLMEKSGKHRLSDVPFSSIRTINPALTQAIRRLLDSSDESK